MTVPSYADAERWEYRFLCGWYLSSYVENDNAVFVWSDTLSHPWLNHVRMVDVGDDGVSDLIDEAERFYRQRDRAPSFHLTPFSRPSDLHRHVEKRGFEQRAELAWMFLSRPDIDGRESAVEVTTVASPSDAEIVGRLFDVVHHDGPPGGVVGDYRSRLVEFMSNPPSDRFVRHYLASIDSVPVGYAALHVGGPFAGIYNVGTVPSARRAGVATALTRTAVNDARRQGAEHVYLVADAGSPNEDLYAAMGFETRFTSTIVTDPGQ